MKDNVDIIPLIRKSWSEGTSALPEQWGPNNPARGQCAVTALLVQEICGGDLLRGLVNGESHYWNRLPSGEEIDLTLEQFPAGSTATETVVRERDYVLSFEATKNRYHLLCCRFGAVRDRLLSEMISREFKKVGW